MRGIFGRLVVGVATVAVIGTTAYAVLLGCGSDAPARKKQTKEPARVQLAHGGGYGKAVFIVAPEKPKVDRRRREDCYVTVDTVDGPQKVECDSSYVVACDIDIPRDKPFCVLVREVGVDRESAYPKHKRQ